MQGQDGGATALVPQPHHELGRRGDQFGVTRQPAPPDLRGQATDRAGRAGADEGFTDPTEIGRGGFAVVFRVRQPAFYRFAALKIIESSVDEDLLLRYERECRALGSVAGHPHIVTLYDAGVTTSGRPYLAMEYLPGGSLAEQLAREGPREWREAVSVGQSLAGALEATTSWASCTGTSSPPTSCGRPMAP